MGNVKVQICLHFSLTQSIQNTRGFSSQQSKMILRDRAIPIAVWGKCDIFVSSGIDRTSQSHRPAGPRAVVPIHPTQGMTLPRDQIWQAWLHLH